METIHQETTNTSRPTNKPRRRSIRSENKTRGHTIQQVEPKQQARTTGENAGEERTLKIEKQNENDTWGHQLQPKQLATIQIILQNIGGINMTETGLIKLAALRDFTQEAQVDVCAITECNVDWRHAPAHLYPKE